MINAIDVYNNCKDQLNESENGQFSYEYFNRTARRAELRLIDWLSGDVKAVQPPEPYLTIKNKDWLAPFIVRIEANVDGGKVPRPANMYRMENWYVIGPSSQKDCETGKAYTTDDCDNPGEVLDGQAFRLRCNSYIPGLKQIPAMQYLDGHFYFHPKDPGSVRIEYIRYPVRAHIATTIDQTYHDQVPNEAATIHFEWDEFASELLVWFIVDLFFNRTREQAGKQFNQATQKTVRE